MTWKSEFFHFENICVYIYISRSLVVTPRNVWKYTKCWMKRDGWRDTQTRTVGSKHKTEGQIQDGGSDLEEREERFRRVDEDDEMSKETAVVCVRTEFTWWESTRCMKRIFINLEFWLTWWKGVQIQGLRKQGHIGDRTWNFTCICEFFFLLTF